jgi:hypothetical protein
MIGLLGTNFALSKSNTLAIYDKLEYLHMPVIKKTALGNDRVLTPLRILGNLSLLAGTLLGVISFFIPGLQIAGIALIVMTTGVGMLGTYVGSNFFYGITRDLFVWSEITRAEQRLQYEIWLKSQTPPLNWFQEKWARLRHFYIPAASKAISIFLIQTQFALKELSLSMSYVTQLSDTRIKLYRLSHLLGNLAGYDPDSHLSDAMLDYQKRIEKLGFHSFSEALDAEIAHHEKMKLVLQKMQKMQAKQKGQDKPHEVEDKEISEHVVHLSQTTEDEKIREKAIKTLISKLQAIAPKRNPLTPTEIAELIEKKGNERSLVPLRTVGSITLLIGIVGTLAASIAFPILPATIIAGMMLSGAIMVATYAVINFKLDTYRSIKKIATHYTKEKEPVFDMWCVENDIFQSIFSPSYLNARLQLIILPATARAFSDFVSNLKTALSEISDEFLDLREISSTLKLNNLFNKIKEGWSRTFPISKKLAEFQEKEKMVSAMLANRRYANFEEGVLECMTINNISKAQATEKFSKILEDDIQEFKKKYPSSTKEEIDKANKALDNMHRRFRGYQRAVANEFRRLFVADTTITAENESVKKQALLEQAINNVNSRHPIEQQNNFIEEQKELIGPEPKSTDPLKDRKWVFLRTFGNLAFAAALILGLLSFAIPGLPALVIPTLMGVGATLFLPYITINFKTDIVNVFNNAIKTNREERIPCFDIWIKKEREKGNAITGLNLFFKRLACTLFPAIQQAVDEIGEKFDTSVNHAITEGTHIPYAPISAVAKDLHKSRKSLNRFEKWLSDMAFDMVPKGFRETEEIIDAILHKHGYKTFEEAVLAEILVVEKQLKDEPHIIKEWLDEQNDRALDIHDKTTIKQFATSRLRERLSKDIDDFNKNFQQELDKLKSKKKPPGELNTLEIIKTKERLITTYYKQYQEKQNNIEKKSIDKRFEQDALLEDDLKSHKDNPDIP